LSVADAKLNHQASLDAWRCGEQGWQMIAHVSSCSGPSQDFIQFERRLRLNEKLSGIHS
jgi:hypothetical protein